MEDVFNMTNSQDSGESKPEINLDSMESSSGEDLLEADTSKNEEEFIWEHRPHPMCIPHIVDNILSYLSISDLKFCRLVNSQYNQICCRNLARNEIISLENMTHLSSYLSFMPISSPLLSSSLGEHLEATSMNTPTHTSSVTTSSSIVPVDPSVSPLHNNDNAFTKENINSKASAPVILMQKNNLHKNCHFAHASYSFKFDPVCEEEGDEGYDTLQEFFTTVGPHIRNLHYMTDFVRFDNPKPFPHMGDIWKNRMDTLDCISLEMKWGIPPVLFKKEKGQVTLPSVKKLILNIVLNELEAERAASFLLQLIKATPNVEEISIPGNRRFYDDYINVVLANIILSLELPHLKNINFCLAFTEPQILALANKNFPLKGLILDFADMFLPQELIAAHQQQLVQEQQQQQQALGNNDENNNENNNPLQGVIIPLPPQLIPILQHPLFQYEHLTRSLQALFLQVAPTLEQLHICFPPSPAHPLHRFTFQAPMMKLSHIALGGFQGTVEILEQMPAIKKIDLWNVRFNDFDYGDADASTNGSGGSPRSVPEKYLDISTVIS